MSATNTISIKDQNKKAGLTAKGDQRQFVQHSYTDRSNDLIENLSTSDENSLRLYREDSVGGPFPIKLQIVLKVTEQLGQQHIISWLPHGRSFMIHRPREFEEEIMGKFFKQTKLTSFRRQLNLYDFQRITHGRDAGSYYHELFLRGKPLLAKKMIRRKLKGTKIRASSSPDDEPNFYAMPYMGPITEANSMHSPARAMMGQKSFDATGGYPSAFSSKMLRAQNSGFSQLGPSLLHQSTNPHHIGNDPSASFQYQQALNSLQMNPMQQGSMYSDLAQAQANPMLSHNSAMDNFNYSNPLHSASALYQRGGSYPLQNDTMSSSAALDGNRLNSNAPFMFNRDSALLDSVSGLRGLSAVARDARPLVDPMLSRFNDSMLSQSTQFNSSTGGSSYPNVPGHLSSLLSNNSSLLGSSVNYNRHQLDLMNNAANNHSRSGMTDGGMMDGAITDRHSLLMQQQKEAVYSQLLRSKQQQHQNQNQQQQHQQALFSSLGYRGDLPPAHVSGAQGNQSAMMRVPQENGLGNLQSTNLNGGSIIDDGKNVVNSERKNAEI
mmetsp:Transcript_32710/g.38105  ORF Transcript_32710/g.38105 Transcript_32710/m.38105 type:complete len:550 (-) Transcript_32710:195-1844(-)